VPLDDPVSASHVAGRESVGDDSSSAMAGRAVRVSVNRMRMRLEKFRQIESFWRSLRIGKRRRLRY
jgi:hypothetical protein